MHEGYDPPRAANNKLVLGAGWAISASDPTYLLELLAAQGRFSREASRLLDVLAS